MKGNDASHDASHVWRVRDLALSIACEEGLSSNSDSMEIVREKNPKSSKALIFSVVLRNLYRSSSSVKLNDLTNKYVCL